MKSEFVPAIELIYDAASDPSVWPIALNAIARPLRAKGAILIWQRDDGTFGTIASEGIAEAQDTYVKEGWFARDIRATRALERGYFFSGEAFGDNQVCSPEEIATSDFYADFLTRHDLRWFGAVAVSPDPRIAVALSVQRDPNEAPHFDADELSDIAWLGRHIEKSLRLSMRLMDAEVMRIGLADAIAKLNVGVCALDSKGRVVFKNTSFEALLGNALQLHHGHLQPAATSDGNRLQQLIAAATSLDPSDLMADPKPFVMQQSGERGPLVIFPISLRRTDDLKQQFLQHARALLIVIEPRIDQPADPAILRDCFGLTLGEARVAALVGAGLAPREASQRLGIAEETARNVLKRAFAKIGVNRQAELASLLSRLSF